MSDGVTIFDRKTVRRHRDRAAAGWDDHDFLVREVGDRLRDRLLDLRREFQRALDLGCHGGTLAPTLLGTRGIREVVQCDLSPAMAARARGNGQPALVADEEALPFADESFDLVISVLNLHWVNDLRSAVSRRATLLRAAEIYRDRFAEPDGRIPLTFEILFLTGWAPHESQQKPLRPGSAKTRLAEALRTTEQPAGDVARPGKPRDDLN